MLPDLPGELVVRTGVVVAMLDLQFYSALQKKKEPETAGLTA